MKLNSALISWERARNVEPIHFALAWPFPDFAKLTFDEAIMRSMAQVVASNNMMLAAQNEAQAQYITKTRVAEAEAQAKRTVAAADKDADQLRGEGNSMLRQQVTAGLAEAGKIMEKNSVDPSFMLYTLYAMWLDAMKCHEVCVGAQPWQHPILRRIPGRLR